MRLASHGRVPVDDQWRPNLALVRIIEPGRKYTHYCVQLSVKLCALADDTGVATKFSLPKVVAEDDNVRGLQIVLAQHSPVDRINSHDVKELRRHDRGSNLFRFRAGGQS